MASRNEKLLRHLNRFNQRIADVVLSRNPLREEAIFLHDKIELDQYHDAHTVSGTQSKKTVVVNKNPDLEYVQELGGNLLLDDFEQQEPWILVATISGFKELPQTNDRVLIGEDMYTVSMVKPLNRDAQSVLRILVYPERNDIPFRIIVYNFEVVSEDVTMTDEEGNETTETVWKTKMNIGFVGGGVETFSINGEVFEGDTRDIIFDGVVKIVSAESETGDTDTIKFEDIVCVTWVVLGEVVSTQYIQTGTDATPPEVATEIGDNIFEGWDTVYTAIETDVTITAIYMAVNDSKVTIKLGDVVIGSFTVNSAEDQEVIIPARAMGITDFYQGDKLVGSLPANQVGDQEIHFDVGGGDIDTSSLEKLDNKVTEIDETSTDEQYPSAKLVYDLVEELTKSIEDVKETAAGEVLYTDTDPMEEAHGGISAGTTFEDVPVTEVIRQILHKPTAPVISISGSPTGGTYEIGTTHNVKFSVKMIKKTDSISSASISVGGNLIGGFVVLNPSLSSGGTFTHTASITTDTKVYATCTDASNRTSTTGTISYTFRTPIYYGLASESEILSNAIFTSESTTKVIPSANSMTDYKTNYPAFEEKRFFFALEGEVSVCKNPSLFDQTASLKKFTTSLTLKDNKVHTYSIYYSEVATQANDYPCYWTFKQQN